MSDLSDFIADVKREAKAADVEFKIPTIFGKGNSDDELGPAKLHIEDDETAFTLNGLPVFVRDNHGIDVLVFANLKPHKKVLAVLNAASQAAYGRMDDEDDDGSMDDDEE